MLTATALLMVVGTGAQGQTDEKPFIGRVQMKFTTDRLTPEALWAMGRIGQFSLNENGNTAVYNVNYYSVKENKSHSVLYTMNMADSHSVLLTQTADSESGAVFFKGGKKNAYFSSVSCTNQVLEMNI